MNVLRPKRTAAYGSQALKRAILRSLSCASNDAIWQDLQRFADVDWRQLGNWLHASGLALYFLQQLQNRGLQNVIPPWIATELRQNRLDNRERTDSLFHEFIRVNEAFRAAQITFVNLKGFALVPEYCPDPTLRSQFDLDFRMHPRFANACRSALAAMGYHLVSQTDEVLEFKSGEDLFANLKDLYKPRSQNCVEVHLASEEPLQCSRAYHDFSFPALSDELTFIYQAKHLAKHLKSEWTRAAWLVEFRNFIELRRDDRDFWNRLEASAAVRPVSNDVGLAMLTVASVLGISLPPPATSWVERLPRGVKRWVEEHALSAILAPFPGTKLYLILLRELDGSGGNGRDIRRKLLPIRLPGTRARGKDIVSRVKATITNTHYFATRLRFHVREGARYLFVARRWSKTRAKSTTHFLSASQQGDPSL